MFPAPLSEVMIAVQGWTDLLNLQPSSFGFVSTGIAPHSEIILSPLERGMRFLFHQWISFNWMSFCLSATAAVFVVILSNRSSKANKYDL